MKISLSASFIIFASSLFFNTPVFSASDNFYTLNQRWEKTNASGKTSGEALDDAFQLALSKAPPQFPKGLPPPTPPLKRTLSQLAGHGSAIEIELGQSLFVKADSAVVKFVATEDGIVFMETVDSNTLRIEAERIGRTFIHMWDEKARTTFELQVLAPRFVYSPEQLRRQEILEKSRSFRIGYEASRNAFYQGEKYNVKQRTSLDFSQLVRVEGDTPYGALSGRARTQRAGTKNVLTDAQLALKDGKVGPLKNFNAEVGDSSVVPDLIVFPQGRVRGVKLDHWDDPKRVEWTGFYGREQAGLIAPLNPGLVTKRTRDSFVGGGIMDFEINKQAKMRTGLFSAYGRSRSDELNKQGSGVQGDIVVSPNLRLTPEVDFDGEHTAHKHAMLLKFFDKVNVRTEYRNVGENFFGMLGSPPHQGEAGYLFNVSARPWDKVSFEGSFDIFHDRLIPNPDDPEALNRHTDLQFNIIPTEYSSLLINFRDFDDTGRVSPTRNRTLGAQVNQRVNFLGHMATLFGRYQYRENVVLNSASSNYNQDQVFAGFYTELFWGIRFSAQYEWSELRETELDNTSYPSAVTYNLDYSRQLWDVPFYLDAHFRMRDEEETEAQNAFMIGEDSTEVSVGLYYREYENVEVFITGRFANYRPESLRVLSPRIEAEFLTGMRYLWDTGFHWNAVGSFKGYVFNDLNADGVRQADEPGIAGMPIKTTGEREAVTDEKGFYELKSVEGKKAVLTLDNSKIPLGFVPTTSARQEIPIVQGQMQEVNFGIVARSEITGLVFNDLNHNETYDLAEKGVGKVRIRLENGAAARSGMNGTYSFPNVIAGEHTAALDISTLPQGYLPVGPPKKNLKLFEGIRYQLNFPVRAVQTVTGRVFVDENKNQVFDSSEKALQGAKVRFGPMVVVSDKEGWYLFDNLESGTFTLLVDNESLPAGLQCLKETELEISAEPMAVKQDIGVERLLKEEDELTE